MSGSLQPLVGYGAAAYKIANSLRFRSSASAYLSRTPASAGNQTTWTWSGWVKRGTLTTDQIVFSEGNTYLRFGDGTADTLWLNLRGNGATNYFFQTTQVFRDPSAWYHIVLAVDTTQATASNRVKLYLNGTQITSFTTYEQYPPQNQDTGVNSTNQHVLGSYSTPSSIYCFDGYMAEVNFIDGQALDPTSFGAFDATTGVWTPKSYAGTYGTNGFHLNFSNGTSTTTLGYDSSGNGNNWTPNNISLTAGSTYDSMLDSPTNYDNGGNGVGNYAVLNPLNLLGSNITTSNANLTVSNSNASHQGALSSVALPSSGNFYAEFYPTTLSSIGGIGFGFADLSVGTNYLSANANVWFAYWNTNLNLVIKNTSTTYGVQVVGSSNVIKLAFNPSNGYAWVGVDSNWIDSSGGTTGNPATNANPTFTISVSGFNLGFFIREYLTGTNANFGQQPFAYTPPSGFKSLCTYNLPTPTIQNGANFMAATLYTGNGATQSISNAVNSVSFQPDFVWIKNRSGANSHQLADSIRGATKYLFSDATNAEETRTNQITSFLTAGFSLDSGAAVNASANNYVGWQWKAGGTAVTNTAGSITSSVSANTTSGFSVVTLSNVPTSGSGTFGHGLGIAPSMVIVKYRTLASYWYVYHAAIGAGSYLALQSTKASAAYANVWNNTSPTSSVITLGSDWASATPTPLVAYCFAAIPGYSAFGSYTGNGSADGPFVYCGFRPRWLMVKRTDSTGAWVMYDSVRLGYNEDRTYLQANSSSAEVTDSGGAGSWSIDLISNGFKLRASSEPTVNPNGGTVIWAAFAENPFTNALAR